MIRSDIEAEDWLGALDGSHSFSDTRPLVFTRCNELSKHSGTIRVSKRFSRGDKPLCLGYYGCKLPSGFLVALNYTALMGGEPYHMCNNLGENSLVYFIGQITFNNRSYKKRSPRAEGCEILRSLGRRM
jgi:hypothetical protein